MLSRLQLGVYAVLVLSSAALAWQVQGWRYERMLAESEALQAQQKVEQVEALNEQLLAERDRRQALEQRLHNDETRHYQELSDAQQTQARLRDRLATADLRLSVLVERDTGCAAVPATTAPGGVDHGAVRARLEPAHARRIIAITDDGDRGLIALRACQAYVRALAP
ncbi:lysis protein [Pseudomonas entomophila]|uniref:lysis system i-spanin subunit Rz n=1 Tax=Pseudomonas entomophila TaxID=312306 RepID=UPI001BCF1677|nr:lysis system i-spanin subunit Rz [Pseudomonas entomophila]QVM90210.1 lysis protein [Pseudomonas entomophila]